MTFSATSPTRRQRARPLRRDAASCWSSPVVSMKGPSVGTSPILPFSHALSLSLSLSADHPVIDKIHEFHKPAIQIQSRADSLSVSSERFQLERSSSNRVRRVGGLCRNRFRGHHGICSIERAIEKKINAFERVRTTLSHPLSLDVPLTHSITSQVIGSQSQQITWWWFDQGFGGGLRSKCDNDGNG